MRKLLLSAVFANTVLSNPARDHPSSGQGRTNANAENGVGTGVTRAIAPPGGVPEGCQTTLADGNRAFGFAVELLMNGRWVNMASLPSGSSTQKPKVAAADLPILPMMRSTETTVVTGAPRAGEGLARAAEGADGRLTIQSTRTHTMTVVLNPTHSAAPVAPPAGRMVALYQIGDGQVQARVPAGGAAMASSNGKEAGSGSASPKSGTKSGPPKGPAGRGGVDQEQSIGGSGRGFGPDDLDMIHGSAGPSTSGSSGSHAQAGSSSDGQEHKMGGMDNMDKKGGSHGDDRLGLELGRGGGLSVPEQEQLGGGTGFPGQDQLGALAGQDQTQAELGRDMLSMGLGNGQQDSRPSELDMQGAGQDMQQSDVQDMLQSDVQSEDDLLPPGPANLTKREVSNEEPAKILSVKLKNGILKDALHRTGYISGGDPQFQYVFSADVSRILSDIRRFDDPPQAGAVYTAGFSVCQDNERLILTLGQRDRFHACLSGTFYNLYQYMEKPMGQCVEARITLLDLQSASSGGPFYERLAIS